MKNNGTSSAHDEIEPRKPKLRFKKPVINDMPLGYSCHHVPSFSVSNTLSAGLTTHANLFMQCINCFYCYQIYFERIHEDCEFDAKSAGTSEVLCRQKTNFNLDLQQ